MLYKFKFKSTQSRMAAKNKERTTIHNSNYIINYKSNSNGNGNGNGNNNRHALLRPPLLISFQCVLANMAYEQCELSHYRSVCGVCVCGVCVCELATTTADDVSERSKIVCMSLPLYICIYEYLYVVNVYISELRFLVQFVE